MANCEKTKPATDEIWAHQDAFWAQDDAQTQLDDSVSTNSSQVKLLIYIGSTYYSRGQVWKAGLAEGRVEKLLIGLPESCAVPAMPEVYDNTASAQFAAGFLYASSQHTMDQRDYILECFQGSDDLTASLYAAMADFTSGDSAAGSEKLTCALPYFFDAMETCDETNPSFMVAEKFYSDFMARDDADSVRESNYALNSLTIDRDLTFMGTTWSQGVFFNTGFFAGEALGLYEGYPDFSAASAN